MIEKILIGTMGITSLMLAWVLVQRLWGRAFGDQNIGEDVLAGRSECGSCGCTTPCANKNLSKNTKI